MIKELMFTANKNIDDLYLSLFNFKFLNDLKS